MNITTGAISAENISNLEDIEYDSIYSLNIEDIMKDGYTNEYCFDLAKIELYMYLDEDGLVLRVRRKHQQQPK